MPGSKRRSRRPKTQPPTSAQSQNLASKSKKAGEHTKPKQDGGNLPDETATPKSTNVASSSVPVIVRQESVTEDETNGAWKTVKRKNEIKSVVKAPDLPRKHLNSVDPSQNHNYGSRVTRAETHVGDSRSSIPTSDNSTYRDSVGEKKSVPQIDQDVVELARNIHDQEYRNWVKAAKCMDEFKKELEKLTTKYSKELHQSVLLALKKDSHPSLKSMCCTGAEIDYQSGEISCKRHEGKTIRLEQLKGLCSKSKSSYDKSGRLNIQCRCDCCKDILKEIQTFCAENFELKKENLNNSNLQTVLCEPWQMAKLFMNKGQDRKVTLTSYTDISGHMSFMLNCTFARDSLEKNKTLEILQAIQKHRNELYHKGVMKITDGEFKKYVKWMIDFLNRYPDLKHGSDVICLIKKIGFEITLEDHKKAVRELITELNLRLEELEQRLEDNVSKTEGEELKEKLNEVEKKLNSLCEQNRTSAISVEDCQSFQQGLIEEYERRYRFLNLSPIHDGANEDVRKAPFEQLYSDIDIRDEKKAIVKSYRSDVFLDSVGKNKNIVIKGVIGIGKSTFCKDLVRTWCHAQRNSELSIDKKAAFSRFKYLFFVPLDQDQGDKTSILEYIYSSLGRLSDKKDIVNYVIDEQSESVLIILDGYEEHSNILTDDKLNKSTVIRTIDSAAYDRICSCEAFKVDSVVTLNGLSNAGIKNLIRKIIIECIPGSTKDTDCETIAKKLKSLDLYESLNNPFILKTLVLSCIKEQLTKSITCNILEMLRCFVLKAKKKYNLGTEKKDEPHEKGLTGMLKCEMNGNLTDKKLGRKKENLKYLDDIPDIVSKIGELAYKGLTDTAKYGSLFYHEREFDDHMRDDFKMCSRLGVITKTSCTPELEEKEITISFLHPHFQDFFSALWIISKKCEYSEWLSYTIHVQGRKNVLRFICGLDESFGSKLSRYIVKLVTKDPELHGFRMGRTVTGSNNRSEKSEFKAILDDSFRSLGGQNNTSKIIQNEKQCLEALTDIILSCMAEVTYSGTSNEDLVIADVVQSNKPLTDQLIQLIGQSRDHLQTILLTECKTSYDTIRRLMQYISAASFLQALTIDISHLEKSEQKPQVIIDLSRHTNLHTLAIIFHEEFYCHLQFGKGCRLEKFLCTGVRMSTEDWKEVLERLSMCQKLALVQLTNVDAKTFFLNSQENKIEKIHLEKMKIEEKILFSETLKLDTLVLNGVIMNGSVGNALFQLPQMEWLIELKLVDLTISKVDIDLNYCKQLDLLLMRDVYLQSLIMSKEMKLPIIELQNVTTVDPSQFLKCFPRDLKYLRLEKMTPYIEEDLSKTEGVILKDVFITKESFKKLCTSKNDDHKNHTTEPVGTKYVRIISKVILPKQ